MDVDSKKQGGIWREIVCVFRDQIYRMRWRFYIAMLKHIIYSNTMGPLKNKSGASTQIKTRFIWSWEEASPSPFFVSLVRDIIFRNVFWRTKCDPNFGFFLFNKITSSFSYSFHYVLIKWLFVSITYSKYCTYLNQIHDAL